MEMADTDLLLVVTQITFRDAACTSLRLEMQHCNIGVGQGAKTGAQVGGLLGPGVFVRNLRLEWE